MQNSFEISTGKTQRMLEIGEIVEVLDGPRTEEATGVTRIRARAMTDGISGWVSLKGNQGTPFLHPSKKPFLYCASEMPLDSQFRATGDCEPIRALKRDEVLEVIGGPKTDVFGSSLRLKARACLDGAEGWFTLKDCSGTAQAAKAEKVYVCVQGIAVTDLQDIKQCKVLRKLAPGDIFRGLEAPVMDTAGGVMRLRGEALKEKVTGWITVKGNAGTLYAEESSKHYIVLRNTPLQKQLGSGGAETIRKLQADEIIEGLEGPTEETQEDVIRINCRAVSDGAVGWVTKKVSQLGLSCLKPWAPCYKCVAGTGIQDAKGGTDAKTLRSIEPGEFVRVIEGPLLVSSSVASEPDLLRIFGSAQKDGTEGWITVRGGEGSTFLVTTSTISP